jgi:hypothetical protein
MSGERGRLPHSGPWARPIHRSARGGNRAFEIASPAHQWLIGYEIMRYPLPDPRQFDILGCAPGLANRMLFGAIADFPRDPEAHRQLRTPPAPA